MSGPPAPAAARGAFAHAWIEHLLPPALRLASNDASSDATGERSAERSGEGPDDADAATRRQARLTVLLTAVLAGTAALYAVFYGAVVRTPAGLIAAGSGALAASGALVALRCGAPLGRVAHVVAGVCFGVVLACVLCSGGLASPAGGWLVMPPLLAALILDRRAAAAWSALGLATLGALAAADAAGIAFPNAFPSAWTRGVTFASLAGLLLCSVVVLSAYERLRADALARAAAASGAMAHAAHHDALTGLPNRAQFAVRLARALHDATAAGRPESVAALVLDLDGFKLVNDSLGHAAGDALLTAVAERLLHATRGCDLVARLGGDEFAVLLVNVHADADALGVAERVVRSVGRPYEVHGTAATIGASVGVARGRPPGDADPGDVAERAVPPDVALLRDADLALYAAKGRGKGQAVCFEPGMHAVVVERLSLESAMRRGLATGEFHVAYQPIVELATGRLAGVEALARWDCPSRGPVSPADFVPLAEETGLIVPLGRRVLEAACRQGAAWAAAHPSARTLTVAVNVSGRQLARPEFVGEVAEVLSSTRFPAERLVLELTESTVIHHPEVARQRLGALKALGVRLAIDDFGTGYSALSYLRQFPLDVLKIDRSFVDPVAQGGQPAALAGAIVALGEALALRTVGEGVETAEQAAALRALGCGFGQGWHFGRPEGAEEIARRLAAGEARADGPRPLRPAA